MCNKIDVVFVDCTNVCDVLSVRGTDIESDHIGTVLTIKNELKPEIEKRITDASRAYYVFLRVLVSINTRSRTNKNLGDLNKTSDNIRSRI
jgi:hypothetical protein